MDDPRPTHLNDQDITRLIDADLGEFEKARIVAHLLCCERCFTAYKDSAASRGMWVGDSTSSGTPSQVSEETRIVLRGKQLSAGARRSRTKTTAGSWFQRPLHIGFVVIAASVLFLCGLWLGNIDQPVPGGMNPDILTPVRSAVETVSMWGPLVLPGGVASLGGTGAAYRSGFVQINEPLRLSLKSLNEDYLKGNVTAEVAQWLAAGYVATGQIDAARDVVFHARKEHPSDPELTTIQALIAYIDGEYARADSLLREVLTADPDNPVASIDLAIVLAELGDTNGALTLLESVRDRHEGTPLAKRAETIIEKIERS